MSSPFFGRPNPWAWVTYGFCLAVFITASFPGWLSIDSLAMLGHATEGSIYDWHSPLLLYAWSHLAPAQLGPTIPFLVQALVFWIGLLLVSGRLGRCGVRYPQLLFPAAFLFDALWTVSWIWKDSFAIAFLVLAIGLAVSVDLFRHKHLLLAAVVVCLALVTGSRWYFAPVMLVALVALAWMADQRSLRVLAVLALGFLVSTSALFAFEKWVIRPTPTYSAGTLLMLDIARVECNVGSREARLRGDSLFPEELIRQLPGDDLCDRFSTYVHDPLMGWRTDEPTQTDYVLPDSPEGMQGLVAAWWEVAKARPGALLEARVKQMLAFLDSDSELWWSPSRQISQNALLYVDGSMGDGEQAGWPSLGNVVLMLAASVTAVGSMAMLQFGSSLFGLFSLVLLPLVAGLVGWRRGRPWRQRYLLALLFPVMYAALAAVVAPAADVRYVMPAATWALVVSTLALLDRPEETGPEQARLNAAVATR